MADRTFPDFGIVIPCKNERKYIPRLMESIRQQTAVGPDTPIVVADAGSTDGTREWLQEWQAAHGLNLRIIGGGLPPRARNLGARELETAYLLFLDADVELGSPDTLERVFAHMQARNLELSVARIRCPEGSWFDRLFWRVFNLFARFKIKGPVVTGMFICITREAFERAGGFREDMLLGDDVELGRQIDRRRFSLAPAWMHTSNRRFIAYGYLRTIGEYLQVFFSRTQRQRQRSSYFEVRYGS
jgi:glycosyltransferase involved in cell wall biosynthesis